MPSIQADRAGEVGARAWRRQDFLDDAALNLLKWKDLRNRFSSTASRHGGC